MITLNAESRDYGNNGHYIARITGRDPKFTFRREFIGRVDGRCKCAEIDEPGLYEICDIDKKGQKDYAFRLIVNAGNGELVELRAQSDNLDGQDGRETAMKIAKRMEAGERLEDIVEVATKPDSAEWGYRIRSAKESAQKQVAMTVETAVESCWQILQALPEREAKKVLSTLKLRISPPKAKSAEPEAAPVNQVS